MEWITTPGLTAYPDALATMAARVQAVQQGQGGEVVWLVEHPPLYTAGSSAKAADLLGGTSFPVYPTGRGGQYTYHGPGQRVAYLMLDLNARGRDLRAYVKQLEQWVIDALDEFGVEGFIREGRVGVWVDAAAERMKHARREPTGEPQSDRAQRSEGGASLPSGHNRMPEAFGQALLPSTTPPASQHNKHQASRRASRAAAGGSAAKGGQASLQTNIPGEAKIAAIGVRVQKWVTSHGICLNVCPDLSHYAGIVPCGIREYGVTSLAALGVAATMADVDAALKRHCPF